MVRFCCARETTGITSAPMLNATTTCRRLSTRSPHRLYFWQACEVSCQEGDDSSEQQLGGFLGDVVTARKRFATNVTCHSAPFVQRLEATMDHALFTP